MNSFNVPVYQAIKKYLETDPVPFHMPGHKLGRGIPSEFLQNLAQWDLTEIPGTDNLHFPSGAIAQAQELAARAFGADETFFLVNGSTCGIHAMILTVCRPGDKLIVARDCHKSVINGMMLAGVDPVYIKPEYDAEFGISTVILPGRVEEALEQHKDAAGVLIARPNYYGICSDIEEIARVTHACGRVLLVDEAHGAHLKFSSRLPVCAMEAGADMCVQSAHKTLPAFTQGAYLHCKGQRVEMDRLKFNLRLLQTSSPSYVIMAFLDIAREIMDRQGASLLEELLFNIRKLEEAVCDTEKMFMLTREKSGTGRLDKTRVVINVGRMGKTGFEVDALLRKEYGIQVEMSDLYNIVCIGTVSDHRTHFEKLFNALSSTANKFKELLPLTDTYIKELEIPEQKVPLKDIMSLKGERIALEKAAGRVSRSLITPYPPGIPVICPGEIIMADAIENIYNIIKSGGVVNGLDNNGLISVVG